MQKRNDLKVIWSPLSLGDVHDIGDFLVQVVASEKAERIVDDVLRAGDLLGEFPSMSRMRDDIYPGLRLALVRPYVVCYFLKGDMVRIARVLHGKQDVVAAFSQDPLSPFL